MEERLAEVAEMAAESSRRDLILAAVEAALAAGKEIRRLYGRPHDIRRKGRIDLVTEADGASEKIILAILGRRFPEIGVMAEESAPDAVFDDSRPLWVIDPLDGTTNFAHGFPWFAVSIALVSRGEPQVGVVYCPMNDELFWGVRGGGAWLGRQRLAVSLCADLEDALVGTGFPYDISETHEEVMAIVSRVLPRIRDLRRAGAAAVDLACVASGRLDGFWEQGLKPWDTAAGALLVSEAGGRLTSFGGDGFRLDFPEVVATNSVIHPLLLPLITPEI